MKKILVVLSVLLILFSIQSCKKEEWQKVSDSTYSELNGEYVYYNYWCDSYGIEEDYFYDSFTFNSTNQCEVYSLIWSYSTTYGWNNSLKEPYNFTETWKVENNQFMTHLYDNEYAEWYSSDFNFIDANNVKIGGLLYTKTNNNKNVEIIPTGKPVILEQSEMDNINKRKEYLRQR
jgi:hypothetical protein